MTQEKTDNWWDSTLDFAALSDIGMRRTNNQDSHREVPAASRRLWRDRGHLFIVADGMGAHAAGELASRLATETIASSYLKRTYESPYDAVKNAVLDAHHLIRQRGDQEEAFHDMGTTADALVLLPEGALVGHVGDSRTYRLRDGFYEQLTFDHSLLWEITRSGKTSRENFPAFIPKNVITRSLGPTTHPEVDLEGPFPLKPGDVFLLCSDGLSGQVTDSEMGQILALIPPEEAVRSLVNLANLRGGPDNVTLIVVKVLGIPTLKAEDRFGDYAKRPPLTPPAWGSLVAAIGLFLLALLLFHSLRFWAILPVAAALGCLGLFLYTARNTLFPKKEERESPAPFGKGPHSRTPAVPDPNFACKLDDICRQLDKAIRERKPTRDRSETDRLAEAGRKAFHEKNFGEAIRLTLRNINRLMETLQPQEGGSAAKGES